jgi:uncharacterized membrane protein
MKTETKIFGFLVAFFLPLAPIYGWLTEWKELTGPVALFLTGMLAALVGFFLHQTGKKLPERPEDNPDALQAEAEGDYGNFSPHSWWPLPVALGGGITFVGLAVGWWLAIIGIFVLVLAVVGWVFEYYHGEYAQ